LTVPLQRGLQRRSCVRPKPCPHNQNAVQRAMADQTQTNVDTTCTEGDFLTLPCLACVQPRSSRESGNFIGGFWTLWPQPSNDWERGRRHFSLHAPSYIPASCMPTLYMPALCMPVPYVPSVHPSRLGDRSPGCRRARGYPTWPGRRRRSSSTGISPGGRFASAASFARRWSSSLIGVATACRRPSSTISPFR
jgi:hypothetical protein